jgi:hypothetical protein
MGNSSRVGCVVWCDVPIVRNYMDVNEGSVYGIWWDW